MIFELRDFIFRQRHGFVSRRGAVKQIHGASELFDQGVVEGEVAANAAAINDAVFVETIRTEHPLAIIWTAAHLYERIAVRLQHFVKYPKAEVFEWS